MTVESVAYVSPFVPPEWIAAHGFRPLRVNPSPTPGRGALAGVCPFAHAWAEQASHSEVRAVVFTTTCDQQRRGSEAVREAGGPPVFLFNVPHTWARPESARLYRRELRRLGRFLVDQGGTAPDDDRLAAELGAWDTGRRKLRAAQGVMTGTAWARAVVSFGRGGGPTPVLPRSTDSYQPVGGVPLALIGGPLWGENLAVYDLIEQAGGRVVLDATGYGERSLPALCDRRRLAATPLQEMVDIYFGGLVSAFRRPNSELYRWLRRELADRSVRALVFVHPLWCDMWQAEARRLKEWSGLPQVVIELSGEECALARAETRLAALVETVR